MIRAFATPSAVLGVLLLLTCPAPAPAQISAPLAALHQQDLRLARIAGSILAANAALCREAMPVTGMVIHSQDQYGDAMTAEFANGPVAVAAVVPGSPAELAGIRPGDGITAIAGRALGHLQPTPDGPVRDAVFRMLAELPAAAPIRLTITRGAQSFDVVLDAPAGCRVLVEVLAQTKRIARSDGRVIQLSYGLLAAMSDDGIAAIFAHELAHRVLEHRRRLAAAGVSKGLLAEFGGNRRRNREAEMEADRLSVHLLANAGLDPQIAPRFWRSREGRSVDAGILRSAIYPSPSQRAEMMERELAEHLPQHRGFSWPAHLLALRDAGA